MHYINVEFWNVCFKKQILSLSLENKYFKTMNNESNIPKSIMDKIGRNQHLKSNHPVCIIKEFILKYLEPRFAKVYQDFSPIVTVQSNFDQLLIPITHPARSKSDTYYVDSSHVLRTHTSAHQNELLQSGQTSFLVIGDVYRKDEIDSTHYPVFHQMEGMYIDTDEVMTDADLQDDLINTLKGLCNYLFPNCPIRVGDDYFPFTNPSFEIEVYHNNRWIEILGCGIIHEQIISNCSVKNPSLVSKRGWAFGLGLERLAMILFEIPDIRLMWTESDKFTSQFMQGIITKFKPFSVLDIISKDVSFYIPNDQVEAYDPNIDADKANIASIEDVEKYTDKKTGIVRIWRNENDMCEVIREAANKVYPDVVAKVEMFDQFYNSKLQKLSRAYRIYYSPPDTRMNDPGEFTVLMNRLHTDISQELGQSLGLTIR